ncbi:MAG: extracellular solute-binding protein [Xenococcaceae cyanobacterium]
MYQSFLGILLLAIALLLSACRNIGSEAEEQLQGRLLIWYSFQGKEAETLNAVLDDYTELYPEVKIVREYVPETEISEEFIQQSQSGLGPDLMIVWNLDLLPLIRAGTIQTLNDYNLDLSTYLPRPISHVTLQDNLYGLPLSLITQVLCYNKAEVDRPPQTLPELTKEVKAGRRVGLISSFLDTFWGVQIFKTQSDSPKSGFTLDTVAWAAWLEWLQQVKKDPNFILANDRPTLHKTFAEGKLAYYVCKSEEISDLKATLGEDNLGVAILPGKANRSAGPPIFTRALVFNQASSPGATKLALQLAQFLTNVEQQTKLALQTESLIPVNSNVKIDERLSPIQAVLFTQSKTAVAVSLDYMSLRGGTGREYGNRFYNRVIEGEMTPREAASEFKQLWEKLNQKIDRQSKDE